MANVAAVSGAARPMTGEEKKVIFASSLGTVFEWYDFYLYGSLAIYIGANFFSQYPETTRNIFALLAFAAGFLVRPFGALVFGRLGDIVGRKYTFLITILIMGVSTFLVGVLPSASQIGTLRAGGSERHDFIGGKTAFGQDIEHFATDVTGGACNCNFETHDQALFLSLLFLVRWEPASSDRGFLDPQPNRGESGGQRRQTVLIVVLAVIRIE